MSAKLVGLVYDGFPSGGKEFDVLLALADSTNESTGRCDPGITYLSWKTRQSERSVQYAIRKLTAGSWIKVKLNLGQKNTNIYVLNRRKIEESALIRRAEYEKICKAKSAKSALVWDEEFGVEDHVAQDLHHMQNESKGVQPITEVVQPAPKDGANGCTLTIEPIINHINHYPAVAGKKVSDPRHVPFRLLFNRYWDSKNPTIPMPWSGACANSLNNFLSANPKINDKMFAVILKNRWESNINHSENPVTAIAKLINFAGGALDQFKTPIEISKGQQRNERQSEVYRTNDSGLEGWLQGAFEGDAEAASSGQLPAKIGTVLESSR